MSVTCFQPPGLTKTSHDRLHQTLQVEPLLYAAGVDMVYTGHTHAYEVWRPCCSLPDQVLL